MLAHQSYQVDEELRINSTNHDLKLTQLIKDRAKSEAERDRDDLPMDRYIQKDETLLMKRMDAKANLIEREITGNNSVKSTPISLSTTISRPTIAPSHVTSSHTESEDDYDEEETTFECTPMDHGTVSWRY